MARYERRKTGICADGEEKMEWGVREWDPGLPNRVRKEVWGILEKTTKVSSKATMVD